MTWTTDRTWCIIPIWGFHSIHVFMEALFLGARFMDHVTWDTTSCWRFLKPSCARVKWFWLWAWGAKRGAVEGGGDVPRRRKAVAYIGQRRISRHVQENLNHRAVHTCYKQDITPQKGESKVLQGCLCHLLNPWKRGIMTPRKKNAVYNHMKPEPETGWFRHTAQPYIITPYPRRLNKNQQRIGKPLIYLEWAQPAIQQCMGHSRKLIDTLELWSGTTPRVG